MKRLLRKVARDDSNYLENLHSTDGSDTFDDADRKNNGSDKSTRFSNNRAFYFFGTSTSQFTGCYRNDTPFLWFLWASFESYLSF
jgi:hypothetical protein